jgi:hypothetical protein
MPEPIIDPITSAVELNSPSVCTNRVGLVSLVLDEMSALEPAFWVVTCKIFTGFSPGCLYLSLK